MVGSVTDRAPYHGDATMRIYNCHTHIFTERVTRDGYLALRMAQKGLTAANAMEELGDRYDELVQEVDYSEEESLSILRSAYPDAASFAVISMDLESGGLPPGEQSYREQLEELARLGEMYGPVVMPFFCVDPRREDAPELAHHYVEERGFTGLALYPGLGFMPFDRRLFPVYEWAVRQELPVIAHCNPEAASGPEPLPEDLESLEESGNLELPGPGDWSNESSRMVVVQHPGHPMHYELVMEHFPGLKLCLSHGGGSAEWEAYPASTVDWTMRNWTSLVVGMLRRHPGVYTDVAGVVGERSRDRLKELLQEPQVQPKILYGSDYHTVRLEGSERGFLMDVIRTLGKGDFRRIAFENPRRFLSSKLHPLT
jgi:predicted TIM-barrel fold metal-dependent hydrolase